MFFLTFSIFFSHAFLVQRQLYIFFFLHFLEDWGDTQTLESGYKCSTFPHISTFPQALPLFMSLACRRQGGWRKYTIFQQLSSKRSTRAGRKLTPMEYFTNNLGYLDTTITFAPEINTSFVSPRWRGSGTFIWTLVIKRSLILWGHSAMAEMVDRK